MEPVLFEKDGPIGWLTLNRPEKRNALSIEVMNAMQTKLDALAKDEEIRVVVIRGNGPAFCAGHNLTEMTGSQYDAHHFRGLFSMCAKMMLTLPKLPQPVIAQVKTARLTREAHPRNLVGLRGGPGVDDA